MTQPASVKGDGVARRGDGVPGTTLDAPRRRDDAIAATVYKGRRARTVEAQLHRRDRDRVELVDPVELGVDPEGLRDQFLGTW